MNRFTIFGDSTQVEWHWETMVTRLESRFYRMTRIESSHNQCVQTWVSVIFTKSPKIWLTKLVRLHTKKWAFCASVMINIGANFLFWLCFLTGLIRSLRVIAGAVEGQGSRIVAAS